MPLLIALSGRPVPTAALRGQPAWRGWRLGFTAGLIYFTGTLYWTSTVLSTFGGVPIAAAIAAMLALAAYLAIFPACAAALLGVSFARWGRAAFALVPAAWVGFEYLRGTLFGGFPWVPLGGSQVGVLPIAQLASVAGVYGLSALVTSISALATYAFTTHGPAPMRALVAGAALVTATAGWGALRVADGGLTREGVPLRVGLVQGNVAQVDKWAPGEARRIFTTYLAMTRDAVRRGAEYVIWPESSTPFMFEEEAEGARAIRALVDEVGVPLLFGSDQFTRGTPPRLYNAAFSVVPGGATTVYRKMNLVPFGEFIPLQEWLSFVSPLVESAGHFSAGESMVLLPAGSESHRISTAICYEAVFPWLAGAAVEAGSELLTTITNDAWYGTSSAPYQHFALASMRAIEQGRYLARSANTGISGVVDPYGRVVHASALFTQVAVVEQVRLLKSRTVYSRIGDAVAQVSLVVVCAALLALRRRA